MWVRQKLWLLRRVEAMRRNAPAHQNPGGAPPRHEHGQLPAGIRKAFGHPDMIVSPMINHSGHQEVWPSGLASEPVRATQRGLTFVTSTVNRNDRNSVPTTTVPRRLLWMTN